MQPKRFSKRLSTAKHNNSYEKSEEAKSMSKKDSGTNLHGKKHKRTNNPEFNKNTEKYETTIDAEATVVAPVSENSIIDMSLFESDTPRKRSGTHVQTVTMASKVGKTGSVDYNTVECKRMEYIRNQEKDPRSAAYLKSGSKTKGPLHNTSRSESPRFRYQEDYSGRPKSGFKSSLSGRQQPKEVYGVHATSFENSADGKSHSKKGYGMHSSSIGSAPAGRCISIWHSHKLNEEHDPYSLDCVFQDEEDNRIQIYIKKEFMFKFEPLLQEGQCYIISNFGVAKNGGRLPLLPNRWEVSFFKGTNVTRVEQMNDNLVGFIFEPFSRILDPTNEYHDHDCVDVIGPVVAIGKIVGVNNHGGPKIRRTIVIEDAELECTFWDNWALMWNDYENRLEEVGNLDILLLLGKVKYWDNKPAVHNALFGSRIFINRKIPPLLLFRKRYESQEGYNANEFKIQLHDQERHVTPAEFMHGCVKRFLGMIRSIEPDSCCVVYATVHSIQYENGWAYTACKACNTRVTAVSSKGGMNAGNKKQVWFCKKQGETYVVASRFKIIVRIVDESGSAQVVIFDNNVHKMTNLSAWQIMEKQGMDPEEYFPDDLNQIIGKQYLFKIKYYEFNHSNNSHIYRTEKVTDDVDTIMYFKNGFLDEEDLEDEEYNMEDYSDNADDALHNGDGGLDDNVDEFGNGEDDSENDEVDFEKEDDELNSGNVSGDNEHDIDESDIGEEDLDTPHVDLEDGTYDLDDLDDERKNTENHFEVAENINTKASNHMEENAEIHTSKSSNNASGVRAKSTVDTMNDPVGVVKKRNRGVEVLSENDCIDEEDVHPNKKMQTTDIGINDA